MRTLKIIATLFATITAVNWLMFFTLYYLSSSSGDGTLGLGIVLSVLGYILSAITFSLGAITLAKAKELELTSSKTGKISIALSILTSGSIFLMYNI